MPEPRQKAPSTPQQSALDRMIAFYESAESFMRGSYYRLGHMEKANMEMGIKQLKRGEYFDAGLRFKFVTYLNKNNDMAYYLLGKTLI